VGEQEGDRDQCAGFFFESCIPLKLLFPQQKSEFFCRWISAIGNFALRNCFSGGTWCHCRRVCACSNKLAN